MTFHYPQSVLKYADSTVLSATFVYRFSLYASERAVSGYEYSLHPTSVSSNISVFRML